MLRGYFAIITAMLIWGSVGVFARWAGTEPLITVTYRVLLAGIALGVLSLVTRRPAGAKPGARVSPWLLGLSGVALALNWLFFFKGLATTSVSNTVLSYYTAPVWVALAAPALLGERLERRTIVATAIAFAGICIMLYQPGQTLSANDLLGIGYGLAAALFYATVTITGRRLAAVPAPRLVLVQCWVAAAILLPAVLLTKGPGALAASPGALGLLAVVGVVHTALALILYFWGMRGVKVQHVGVLSYLDPVSAVLFAFIFLKEVPSGASLAGGALVLLGSAVLMSKPKQA
ncbi:MAG TPA: DMT family transporter [Symbiobacteriaceae bacterium]|nr:DMT family transporter [Symbiobacteriaceae bacterium]